jgi:hypothetical protein
MRQRINPFTGELEDDPPPTTFLCPQKKRPDRKSISAKLGFRVPAEFVQLAEWIYDEADGDPYRCCDEFGNVLGVSACDQSVRYDSTPCELFPFGWPGVDGVHYGYVVHAPELQLPDYPVGHYCPADSDGVVVKGKCTTEGLAAIARVWRNKFGEPRGPSWLVALVSAKQKSVQSRTRVINRNSNYHTARLEMHPIIGRNWGSCAIRMVCPVDTCRGQAVRQGRYFC